MASEVWLSPPSRLPSVANPPPRFAYKSRPTASFLISPSSRTPRALPALRRRVLLRRRLRATEQQGSGARLGRGGRQQRPPLLQHRQEAEEDARGDGAGIPPSPPDQSFYYDQKAIMSNEEFDNLKEELMWEGSSVVMLSPDEQRLLEASMAYAAGKPIMSDAEFDELKLRLKKDGSDIVTEGPRCSLRSRKVYSDLTVDYLKMFLLNVPATAVALGLFFFIDELTGFEINVFQLPEPFRFIFTWFAALPLILFLAQSLTNAIVQDFLILKGPCPNCGTENLSFFGIILSVSSGGTTNIVKCANCSTELVYDSKSRLITLPEPSKS